MAAGPVRVRPVRETGFSRNTNKGCHDMDKPFYPLFFGGDFNVYSMARAFHEAYGIKSACFGKFASGPDYKSDIIDYRVCAQNEEPAAFCKNVTEYASAHADGRVVIGCSDHYVRMAAMYRDKFPDNCVVPYISAALMDELNNKERFYALCDKYGLDYPATVIHRKEMGHGFDLPFGPPFICKPASGVEYWAHPFSGNDKVFVLPDRAALEATLDKVYASGYENSMIIQEYVPGDDTYMRVLTNYSDRNGKVKLMCLGHTLLEEHSPHGMGNHSVILTEPNEELCGKIKPFLEDMGYVGFSNLDIKFDQRDGKYKFFELNCRQGRSNYYVTGAGYNLAKLLVEDLLEEKELPLVIAKNRSLWRVVPEKVAFDYTPSNYHQEMRALIRAGASHNPLHYAPDKSMSHRLRVFKEQMRFFSDFKKYYGKKS